MELLSKRHGDILLPTFNQPSDEQGQKPFLLGPRLLPKILSL